MYVFLFCVSLFAFVVNTGLKIVKETILSKGTAKQNFWLLVSYGCKFTL